MRSHWPWPGGDIAYFRSRAKRAVPDHPKQRQLIARFMSHLARQGEPDTDGPVRQLRRWAQAETISELRGRLLAFDVQHTDAARLAQAEAGMPNRRGDIVQIRSKAFWWEMRTK